MDDGFFIQRLPSVKGRLLDAYLHAGWYRMGANIFTTRSFEDNLVEYRVFWLRYRINAIRLSGSSTSIIKKNKSFSVSIRPFELTEELERLHDLYFEKIDFITSFTIAELLEDVENMIYDSWLIEVRDNNKLIAAGIFDKGENTIAGIKNIYHPDYQKYSLGKYLILIKLQFCIQNNIEFYYPGYIAPGHAKFDYKLSVDKSATEVLDTNSSVWLPYMDFCESKSSNQ